MKKYCQVVLINSHTQKHLLPLCQKKAHLMEIQVNKGSLAKKLDLSLEKLEHHVPKCYHHCTEIKKIYKINQGYLIKDGKLINASTNYDLSDKSINPLGGFIHYGEVTNDCVIRRAVWWEPKSKCSPSTILSADQAVGSGKD
ncbi:hypothetical protein P7K49_027374 [Saguinus oedipus]|uniref:60S ribosomal protein L3 n=1 Tax=Saguinus oedipus TaxID=9490 RepID=A0ABQ9U9R5_SAGOE|nr:hypothetical protein P7K49_027374 [Saguinus oedipus]